MTQVHKAAPCHPQWLWSVLVLIVTMLSSAALAEGVRAVYANDSGPRDGSVVVTGAQVAASEQVIHEDRTAARPFAYRYDDPGNLARASARLSFIREGGER